jgi:hypothetical protein
LNGRLIAKNGVQEEHRPFTRDAPTSALVGITNLWRKEESRSEFISDQSRVIKPLSPPLILLGISREVITLFADHLSKKYIFFIQRTRRVTRMKRIGRERKIWDNLMP